MKVVAVLLFCFTNCLAQERNVFIEQMGECDNPNGTYPFEIVKMLVHRKNKHSFVVSGIIIVHETLTGNLSNYLLMTKCGLKESPDTCEVYTEVITANACESIHEKDQAWYTFLNTLNITQCPIQKGKYEMNGAPIDMSIFTTLPASLGYWKLRGELKNETHVICCVQGSFVITPKRPPRN